MMFGPLDIWIKSAHSHSKPTLLTCIGPLGSLYFVGLFSSLEIGEGCVARACGLQSREHNSVCRPKIKVEGGQKRPRMLIP